MLNLPYLRLVSSSLAISHVLRGVGGHCATKRSMFGHDVAFNRLASRKDGTKPHCPLRRYRQDAPIPFQTIVIPKTSGNTV
jgi:hypothetical protein